MVKTEERGMLAKRVLGPSRVCKLLINNNLELEINNKVIRRNIHQIKRFKSEAIIKEPLLSESIISPSTWNKDRIEIKTELNLSPVIKRRYPERK